MRKMVVPISLCLGLLLGLTLASAQTENDDPPFVISAYNRETLGTDLYAYDGSDWRRLTERSCNYGVILSPEGKRVAYLDAPPFTCGDVPQGYGYLFGAAWNIALLDLATGQQREVAGQPANIQLPDAHGAIQRSEPVWSPDGQALAWTEQHYPAEHSARLMVATLTTETPTSLDETLPQMTMSESGLPTIITWGTAGIVVFTNDPTDGAETLRVYDPAGGEARVIRLPDDVVADWYPQSDLLWVGDGKLVIQADALVWYEVDLASGQVSGFANKLALSSVTNPAELLRLTLNPFAFFGEDAWQLSSADGTVLHSWQREAEGTPSHFTIAPTGQAVAYRQGDGLYMWRDGAFTRLELPDDLSVLDVAWGATQWERGEAPGAIG